MNESSAPGVLRRTHDVWLARHGETAWSISGQHTGLTDIPLTPQGESNARNLAGRLRGTIFVRVFASPLQRAARTCGLAGFGAGAIADPDLVEWDYGDYEGKTSEEIHRQQPDWFLFRDGCPDGETPEEVARRADRVIARLRSIDGATLLFSHGHFLRVLAARWLGLEPLSGRCFHLGTAALSILGYEHDGRDPVLKLWNDCGHVRP